MIPYQSEHDEAWIEVAGHAMARQFGRAAATEGVGRWRDSDTGGLVEGPIIAVQSYPADLTAADLSVVRKLAELLKAALVRDGIALVIDDDLIVI